MRILRIFGVVLIAAVVAAAVSTLVVLNNRVSTQVGRGPLITGGQGVGALAAVQGAEPSVVRVERSAPAASPGSGTTPAFATPPGGSGVVIDGRGYVLTAEALVAGTDALWVAVPGGHTVPARVVGSDPLSALTLLKIDTGNLRSLPLAGASTMDSGAGVVVLAAPPAPQVAVGAVASAHASTSVVDPSNPSRKRALNDLLTLDVAARDGQLGAPLLDGSGRLAGLVVATTPQVFAVDMSQAQSAVQQLLESGHVSYPTLGFDYQQLTATEAADRGVPGGIVIVSVAQGLASSAAQLAVGDVVVSANGTILTPAHPLQRLLRGMSVHQSVALAVRSGSVQKNIAVDVQLASP
ncbi:MAG: S1C family serine protease [Candidatus Dormibacteria bacterium]